MPVRIYSNEEEFKLANDFDIYLFLKYSWTQIAVILEVDRKTLFSIRKRINYIPRLLPVLDNEVLDNLIRGYIHNHPETGILNHYS